MGQLTLLIMLRTLRYEAGIVRLEPASTLCQMKRGGFIDWLHVDPTGTMSLVAKDEMLCAKVQARDPTIKVNWTSLLLALSL